MQAVGVAVIQEFTRTVSQSALVWAGSHECPACHCAPVLHCAGGTSSQPLASASGCPGGSGHWWLALGVVIGAAAGVGFTRWLLTPSGPQAHSPSIEDQARAQLSLVRGRGQ